MNMVGYKLMQKYGLLSLSHDATKRIVFAELGVEAERGNPLVLFQKCFHSMCFYSAAAVQLAR